MLNDVVNSVSSVSLVSAGSSHMDLQLEAPHKLLMHAHSLASIGCLMQPVTLPYGGKLFHSLRKTPYCNLVVSTSVAKRSHALSSTSVK